MICELRRLGLAVRMFSLSRAIHVHMMVHLHVWSQVKWCCLGVVHYYETFSVVVG